MAKRVSSIPSAFLRHWPPACTAFTAVIVAALAYLMVTPRLYEASARLILDEKKVSVSDLGRDLAQLSNPVPGGPSPIATQAELIKSQRVLKRALAEVEAKGEKGLPTVTQLARGLRVKIVPATNILDLNYQGQDPALASDLLNAVMRSMINENIESIRAGARSVKTFLEAKVPQQQTVLMRAEEAETRYRQTNGLISVADQTRKLVEGLGTVESQERDLSAQLREVAARNLSLARVIDAGTLRNAYESARVGQDEELKALRIKLVDLESRVIDGRSRLGDQHPDLLALIEQRDANRALYGSKLSRLLSGRTVAPPNVANDPLSQDLTSKLIISGVEQSALGQKLVAVQAERLALQARLVDLPAKQQPLATLIREREEAEANLKLLQAKLQEATIAEAQLVSNVQIIAEAEPPLKPESPKKTVVLVTAIVFGLILTVGIVLLLELLDNSLHDASEAEELLGQPSLGALPLLPAHLIRLHQAETFLDDARLVEPYRKLLKTLEFRSAKKLRLLVISSAVANEGKSTVAAHLAAVSAMLSQRTLLIDADLRQPEQHTLFDVPLEPGLTHSVDGTLSLHQAVQPTGTPYLSVLTCGKPPQRPFLVLESAAMKALLEEAAHAFDLVIVDTPPIVSCADAVALSRQSDGLMFVVRPGVSTQKGLTQSLTELKKNGVPLMGFVVNGVEHSLDRDYFKNDGGHRPLLKFLQRLPLPAPLRRWSAIAMEIVS